MKTTRWVRFASVIALLLSSAIVAVAQGPSVAPLVRVNPNNRAKPKVVGMTPAQIRHAYGFDQISNQGAGQTIAIVSAFDLPTIESDLAVFNTAFGLPACTTANGCFLKAGTPPPPDPNVFAPAVVELFQLESALDVQWAHAIAPQAKIVLVQSNTAFLADMLANVDTAVQTYHANVVSMSWGLPETRDFSGDYSFLAANVSFVAASGDSGNPGLFPAASPNVTAVGGTKLNLRPNGDYDDERSWGDSGGGLSTYFFAAPIQQAFTFSNPLQKRGIPDVAYDADPNTGVAVYSATLGGWSQVGGTSAGAPQWSGLIAIANSMRVGTGKPKGKAKPVLSGANTALYLAAYSGGFNDITAGQNNGNCGDICKPAPGYDYLTGLGSPKANVLIPALVNMSVP